MEIQINQNKLKRDKRKVARRFVWACALAMFGLLGVISIATSSRFLADKKVGGCIFYALFILIGLYLMKQGIYTQKLLQSFPKYHFYIAEEQIFEIKQLAIKLNQSLATVRKSLDDMIKRGYFKNILIDYQGKKIIIRESLLDTVIDTIQDNLRVKVSVNCPNCGAVNGVYTGQTQNCEYCGTPITAKNEFFS